MEELEMAHIIQELKDHAGTQFDSNIVKYMLAMIDEGIAPVLGMEAEM